MKICNGRLQFASQLKPKSETILNDSKIISTIRKSESFDSCSLLVKTDLKYYLCNKLLIKMIIDW